MTNLTPEQKKLLLEISANEDRILEGELYGWQKEVLKQYEFALAYLNKKYPSHTFSIVGCDPKTNMNLHAAFWFRADEKEALYELHVKEISEGQYEGKDNYYAFLFEQDYAQSLLEKIQDEIPECIFVSTHFGTVQGEEYGEQKDAAEVITDESELSNQTTVYLKGTETNAEALYEKVKSWMTGQKVYGAYKVRVLADIPEEMESKEAFAEYLKNHSEKNSLLKKDFQQFVSPGEEN